MGMNLFAAAEEAGTRERVERVYPTMTMEELQAIPWNGLTAIGSFSGCGGASTGLRMSGWRVPVAVEFIPAAAETYRANSSAHVVERDIREVTGEELLDLAGLKVGELDLYEGSPPCSSFSAAGTGHKTRERPCDLCEGRGYIPATTEEAERDCERCEGTGRLEGESKSYSDSAQRTDDLFDHYVRLIDEMKPRAFLAENVPGMITGPAIDYVRRITAQMGGLGYRCDARVMNAAAYGAATERERLIFIGLRNDLETFPTFPAPTVTEPYTIADALAVAREDHPEDVAASSMEGKAVGRTWHAMVEARDSGRELDTAAIPCERCGKPAGEHQMEQRPNRQDFFCADGGKAIVTKLYYLLVVPRLDQPCPTITATGSQVGAASVTHPTSSRKLTPREAATIMGFPQDFHLTGTREQRYERVGRAVAPPLYRAVGAHIAGLLGG